MIHFLKRLNQLSPEKRRYTLQSLPAHLAMAGQNERLRQLLTHFHFLAAKVSELGPQPLIKDYQLCSAPNLRLIQKALRLCVHILTEDTEELAGQLIGRLMSCPTPEVTTLLEGAQSVGQRSPWIRPLTPSLTSASSPLVRRFRVHSEPVNAVVILPDGQRAISAAGWLLGSTDKTLKIWNLQSGEILHRLAGHSKAVRDVALSAKEQLAVSASDDGTLKVWDLKRGQEMSTLVGHTGPVRLVAIVPNQPIAVSASWDKTVRIWGLHSGREIERLTTHGHSLKAMAFWPDKPQLLIVLDDTTIKILNWLTGRQLNALTVPDGFIKTMAPLPDGYQLLLASNKGQLIVWDFETGTKVHTLKGTRHPIHPIHLLAITSDGRRAVSASSHAQLNVWDLEQGVWWRTIKTGSG